jgi:hypothetical protein
MAAARAIRKPLCIQEFGKHPGGQGRTDLFKKVRGSSQDMGGIPAGGWGGELLMDCGHVGLHAGSACAVHDGAGHMQLQLKGMGACAAQALCLLTTHSLLCPANTRCTAWQSTR